MNNARSRFLGRGPFLAQRRPIRLWASEAVARRSANCVLNSSVQWRNWPQCLPRSRTPLLEQPAIDVFALHDYKVKDDPLVGVARIGELIEPRRLAEFGSARRPALGRVAVAMVGHPQWTVQRVAVACGAGDEFLKDAARGRHANVLLTGEARFHPQLRPKRWASACSPPAITQRNARASRNWPNESHSPSPASPSGQATLKPTRCVGSSPISERPKSPDLSINKLKPSRKKTRG